MEMLKKRIEKFLEVLGMAVGLTLIQAVVLYILFGVDFFGQNVFLIYRNIFETFLFVFDRLYFLFVNVMYAIFGESYLHAPAFNNIFKLIIFTIFLINLAYFSLSYCLRLKDENSNRSDESRLLGESGLKDGNTKRDANLGFSPNQRLKAENSNRSDESSESEESRRLDESGVER